MLKALVQVLLLSPLPPDWLLHCPCACDMRVPLGTIFFKGSCLLICARPHHLSNNKIYFKTSSLITSSKK